MANTKMLEQRIEESGVKKSFISGKLGLTKQAFYKRLKRNSVWSYTQVKIIAKILNLTESEVDEIFFN